VLSPKNRIVAVNNDVGTLFFMFSPWSLVAQKTLTTGNTLRNTTKKKKLTWGDMGRQGRVMSGVNRVSSGCYGYLCRVPLGWGRGIPA
jgi:hypothetical protein